MNIAMPFAVADRNTEPSSDIATKMVVAAMSATPGPTTWSGQCRRLVHDHQHRGVEDRDVGDAYPDRTDEAPEEKLRSSEWSHDQRLKQAALGVTADRPEGEEHGEHRRQKQ